jgi:predicted neuraminidase
LFYFAIKHADMRKRLPEIICLFLIIAAGLPLSAQKSSNHGILKSENIFLTAPFAECHASTIAETADGLAVAFFAGTAEKNPDVSIWICFLKNGNWTEPKEIANGISPDGKRYACWNPVLDYAGSGKLLLFYKVGADPTSWWGMLMQSEDNGNSWGPPERLPVGILGPIKNKAILLPGGELLCPASSEKDGWKIYFEQTPDLGKTWTHSDFVADPDDLKAIQPTILIHRNGNLQALCRTMKNVVAETWSEDGGITWSPLKATNLPNPNSGIDAVTLRNGRQLLVYNPTTVPEGKWGGPRSPISLAISKNGKKWHKIADLETEPGEFSYPAVIQTTDGKVHITYTWKRSSIRHVVIDF